MQTIESPSGLRGFAASRLRGFVIVASEMDLDTHRYPAGMALVSRWRAKP
jgi:hypothetical protein